MKARPASRAMIRPDGMTFSSNTRIASAAIQKRFMKLCRAPGPQRLRGFSSASKSLQLRQLDCDAHPAAKTVACARAFLLSGRVYIPVPNRSRFGAAPQSRTMMIARLVMLIDRPGRREAARGGHGAMIAHSRSVLGQVGGTWGVVF